MKKIPVRTLYLLLVIGIGLVGLGIGSTYAVFTTSSEIDSPITLNSNLHYSNDIMETIEVIVPAGQTVSSTLNINNTSNSALNYTVWYLDEGEDIEAGTSSGVPTGTISSGNSTSVTIDVRNNGTSGVTVTIGISSSKDSVILGNDMIIVPATELIPTEFNLLERITNLYLNTEKTTISTVNGIEYNYAPSVGLMNDRLGGTTSDYNGGNIRYYGEDPDNYIYFNCSDYSNQSNSTCEKWRIIGIVDGKVKIIRTSSIGSYAWANESYELDGSAWSDNNWVVSPINEYLNGEYYNNLNTINNKTTELISNTTYYLGGYNTTDIFSDEIYIYERTNEVGTTILSGNPFTVDANIGLMYASDYGYAADLDKCNSTLFNLEEITDLDGNIGGCYNWIYDSINNSYAYWLITPNSHYDDIYAEAWTLLPAGTLEVVYMYTISEQEVLPVLYLDTTLTFSGDGTSSNPYRVII